MSTSSQGTSTHINKDTNTDILKVKNCHDVSNKGTGTHSHKQTNIKKCNSCDKCNSYTRVPSASSRADGNEEINKKQNIDVKIKKNYLGRIIKIYHRYIFCMPNALMLIYLGMGLLLQASKHSYPKFKVTLQVGRY